MPTNRNDPAHKSAIPFSSALTYWLKLGFISFGGPAGQISMMHQELVEKRHWISEKRFLHALNYTMVLPGPEAQQLATYIGWLMHGSLGGIVAGTLFVLPSLIILILLSWVYLVFGDLPSVVGILYGIKPAVTSIVLFAAYRIGNRVLKNSLLWALAISAFLAIFVWNISFPWIVLTAGLIAYIDSRFYPTLFQAGDHALATKTTPHASIIDDDTSIPRHAAFKWRRLIITALIGLSLWIAAIGILSFNYGWHGVLTQMAWFFTKAALLTIGGAYAVLPYVYQGAVEHYQWLTAVQMIDGLALGETTPGPLIMIVAFVGFVGGWTNALFGNDALLHAGITAACLVTFFTFLPSFLFILIGGPIVERTRDNIHFTAPLTGITAAVVGVIVNLAVFFAYHTFWPQGFDNTFEWAALVIGVLAFIALTRFKIGIVTVIAACAAIGYLISIMTSSL